MNGRIKKGRMEKKRERNKVYLLFEIEKEENGGSCRVGISREL
jgi:hypothetical protein